MLYGIDVSNWQGSIDVSQINCDFIIAKATGGCGFVDPYCDETIQQCIKLDRLWAFYHYANDFGYSDPDIEAAFFVDNCANYFGHGIPVLDFEVPMNDGVAWCEAFAQFVYDATDVWPIIYLSALNGWSVGTFAGSWIPSKCGLWIAGYPYYAHNWIKDACPYNIYPWEVLAMWQFTSQLHLSGYSGDLDGNIAYMDREAWMKYAMGDRNELSPDLPPVQPVLDQTALINEILDGKWGNGETRRKRLTDAGYDAEYLQDTINELYDIADQVIQGRWGNGWNREQALTGAGYDYNTVQRIVNALLDD